MRAFTRFEKKIMFYIRIAHNKRLKDGEYCFVSSLLGRVLLQLYCKKNRLLSALFIVRERADYVPVLYLSDFLFKMNFMCFVSFESA